MKNSVFDRKLSFKLPYSLLPFFERFSEINDKDMLGIFGKLMNFKIIYSKINMFLFHSRWTFWSVFLYEADKSAVLSQLNGLLKFLQSGTDCLNQLFWKKKLRAFHIVQFMFFRTDSSWDIITQHGSYKNAHLPWIYLLVVYSLTYLSGFS